MMQVSGGKDFARQLRMNMAQDPETLEEEPQQRQPAEAQWLSLCPLSSVDMTFASLPPPTLTRIPLMANPDLEP